MATPGNQTVWFACGQGNAQRPRHTIGYLSHLNGSAVPHGGLTILHISPLKQVSGVGVAVGVGDAEEEVFGTGVSIGCGAGG